MYTAFLRLVVGHIRKVCGHCDGGGGGGCGHCS